MGKCDSLKYVINIVVIEHYCRPQEILFLFIITTTQPGFNSQSTIFCKHTRQHRREAPLLRVRSVGRCDKAGKCLRSSSVICHVRQAAHC